MSNVVLDASALLALIYQEPGHEIVAHAMPHAIMSAINISEVLTVLYSEGMPEQKADQEIVTLVKEIVDFDTEQARLSAKLRKLTKAQGLSFGDRACLALAKSLELPVLTADKIWTKINLDIKIKVIR